MAEMTRARLIECVRTARGDLGALLDRLTPSQLTAPNVHGTWSIVDMVAHVVAWEERMVEWLGQALDGTLSLPNWNAVNRISEATHRERAGMSLGETLAAFQRLGSEGIAAIEAIPEDDLVVPGRYPGMRDEALWHLVAANTFWHYPAYTRAIRAWLANNSLDPHVFYAYPGPLTDPKGYGYLFGCLPRRVSVLTAALHGLLLHDFWAARYGAKVSDERRQDLQLRSLPALLARLRALDDRPFTQERLLEDRLIGNCRSYAVLLCAMLRWQGVPARARCGFGRYLLTDRCEDHWVCEYWNDGEDRWVLVDAQLDAFQQGALGIRFDPLDVPRDQFVVAGEAWRTCRAGEGDADRFGTSEQHGLGFVRGNLIRDFLAMNKVEILPWDGGFGVLAKDAPLEGELMDRIAALTTGGDAAFTEVRALHAADARLRVPDDWIP